MEKKLNLEENRGWQIAVPPYVVIVKLLSRVQLFATPMTVACQVSLCFTISQSLLRSMSIQSEMPTNHLVLCCLLLLPSVSPSLFPVFLFSNESTLHIRWPKDWSYNFSISPSKEDSGLISFGIDWFDLLAVQGTLKSLLQHHSLKASVLQCSAFFMVQLSHLYMITGKTIALTRQTFFTKWKSAFPLSSFVTAFLPRSNCLLI